MARILVVYGSDEGQTEKVAKHMAAYCQAQHHEVDLVHGRDVEKDFSIAGYDGVIVGASIHMGRHQKYMINFARRYADELATRLSAFFTVCLTARSDSEEDKAEVERYVDHFIDTTGWNPDQIGVFAGALVYTRYGLVRRYLMKSISKRAGMESDTSRDYDYTDWESVGDFVEMFDTAIAPEPVLAG